MPQHTVKSRSSAIDTSLCQLIFDGSSEKNAEFHHQGQSPPENNLDAHTILNGWQKDRDNTSTENKFQILF